MSSRLEDTTRDPRTGSRSATRQGGELVPALSVIWHPEPARIGEVAPLEALTDAGGSVLVSRLAPLFGAPGSPPATPLDDLSLSRSQAALEIHATGSRGQLQLRPGKPAVPTEVDGVELERPVLVDEEDLDRGVILLAARRVVLCLHRLAHPATRGPHMGLLGGGDAIDGIRQAIGRVADLEMPVLIRGETGTGKELVARAILERSRRADRPFVAVNVATIPSSTAAAELFGYERGAFTGAAGNRGGYYGAAAGGTLFLDEIGAMPMEVQEMMLRALETGEIAPLGAGRARKVDVRILAATDADLETTAGARPFSQPLFQRLAGFQIVLPPVRERREDIGTLLVHFLREALSATGEADRLQQPGEDGKPWLSASKVAALALGTWPGNVRALRNAARQIAVASRGRSRAVVDEMVERLAGPRERELVRPIPSGAAGMVSEDALLETLRKERFSPSAAAAALNIPRTTLYALMDKHPGIRKASAIPGEELMRHYEESKGDLDVMVERLQVSKHALKLRLTELRASDPRR
jgi:two-component system nitrogen regulation response regulator GlnG